MTQLQKTQVIRHWEKYTIHAYKKLNLQIQKNTNRKLANHTTILLIIYEKANLRATDLLFCLVGLEFETGSIFFFVVAVFELLRASKIAWHILRYFQTSPDTRKNRKQLISKFGIEHISNSKSKSLVEQNKQKEVIETYEMLKLARILRIVDKISSGDCCETVSTSSGSRWTNRGTFCSEFFKSRSKMRCCARSLEERLLGGIWDEWKVSWKICTKLERFSGILVLLSFNAIITSSSWSFFFLASLPLPLA